MRPRCSRTEFDGPPEAPPITEEVDENGEIVDETEVAEPEPDYGKDEDADVDPDDVEDTARRKFYVDRQDLRRRLAALAGLQSGYFTAAQAKQVGYSYQAQKFHVDRGNWHRIDRGLFRLPEWPIGPHDHLVRWSLWARGRAVVSHDTALAVHDLGEANPAPVHLTVPPNFRSSAVGVVLHRSDVPEGDVWQFEGFRVTSPVRTILDVAASTSTSINSPARSPMRARRT